MSSVGLALSRTTSVSQEFAQEPAANRIPISPTRDAASAGPGSNSVLSDLPEDTVTISNALLPAPRNQPTKGGVLHGENSVAPETSLAAAGSYDLLNAKSGSNPSAVSSAQVKADGTPKASKTAAAQASSVTAQEQLQQLDRTLQQLGINPRKRQPDSARGIDSPRKQSRGLGTILPVTVRFHYGLSVRGTVQRRRANSYRFSRRKCIRFFVIRGGDESIPEVNR